MFMTECQDLGKTWHLILPEGLIKNHTSYLDTLRRQIFLVAFLQVLTQSYSGIEYVIQNFGNMVGKCEKFRVKKHKKILLLLDKIY